MKALAQAFLVSALQQYYEEFMEALCKKFQRKYPPNLIQGRVHDKFPRPRPHHSARKQKFVYFFTTAMSQVAK